MNLPPANSAAAAMPVVVYMAGKDMDDSTEDRALAEALAQFCHVLWVDPAEAARSGFVLSAQTEIHRVSPTFTRVRTTVRSRSSRAFSRVLVRRALGRSIDSALGELGAECNAIMLSDPLGRFPVGIAGHRFFYVTGDWVGAAPAAGMPRRAVRKSIEVNCTQADTIAAVSQTLALRLHLYSKTMDAVRVVPTGCTVSSDTAVTPHDLPPTSSVALIGTLDDRFDYDVLDAVAATGLHIVVIGKRETRSASTLRRVDAFLSRPNVHWLGARPDAHISDYLLSAVVGLAPFAVNADNRARFPTQTLDYLAAGLAVVATDLPSTRGFGVDHVVVAQTPRDFADKVTEAAAAERDSGSIAARKELASSHSWTARAITVLRLTALYRHTAQAPRSFVPLRRQPPA